MPLLVNIHVWRASFEAQRSSVIALLEREATVLDPKHSRLEIGLKAQGSRSELEDPIATRIEPEHPGSRSRPTATPPQPGSGAGQRTFPNCQIELPKCQSHE